MMQEHMNVEECQALGSSQFMLMVSCLFAPVVRHLGIIFVTPHHYYNAMFFGIKLFLMIMMMMITMIIDKILI